LMFMRDMYSGRGSEAFAAVAEESKSDIVIESDSKDDPVADPSRYEAHSLKEAYDKNICTYNATGRSSRQQRMFSCKTCRLNGSNSVCLSCARVCHDGHEYDDCCE
jgi:hypothetical protein